MGCHFLRGWGIPLWLSGKKISTCNVEDVDSILGLGRAPGEGNGNLLQCIYNPWTEEPGRLQSMGSKKLDMTEGLNTHILQMIFLTQGSNPHLSVPCLGRYILYHGVTWEAPDKWQSWNQIQVQTSKAVLWYNLLCLCKSLAKKVYVSQMPIKTKIWKHQEYPVIYIPGCCLVRRSFYCCGW